MSVFLLAEIEKITEENAYREYAQKAAPIVSKYGGEYIYKSENFTPISGDWDLQRMILIRFDNKDQLQKCFQSVEYREIAPLRERSTLSKAIIIEDKAAP